jgi:hypothetical protein
MVALIVPIIFLISMPFALINPLLSMAIWWAAPFASLAVLKLYERYRSLAACRREKADWAGIGHRHRGQVCIALKTGSSRRVSMV